MDSFFEHRRILLLDFYDSFTHNLASLLRCSTGATVHVVTHDNFKSLYHLVPCLRSFDAVVIGPGPGSPDNPDDIGVAGQLWTGLSEKDILPVFGVCLGLQSLCLSFGGELKRLKVVKHGLISNVEHVGRDIFKGVGKVNAVRYHSLHVDMHGDKSEIEELAWAHDGGANGTILMGARHRRRPYWAVQYHPESICTEGGGWEVMRNWWGLAISWSIEHGRKAMPLPVGWKTTPRLQSLLQQHLELHKERSPVWTHFSSEPKVVSYVSLNTMRLPTAQICELLGAADQNKEFAFLDSALFPGRYSIIGILDPESTELLSYFIGEAYVTLSSIGQPSEEGKKINLCKEYSGRIWQFLAVYMSARRAISGPEGSPFWGGLIGYLTYELGIDSLKIPLAYRFAGHKRPDVHLAYVERSIVVDSLSGTAFIQSLKKNDSEWLENTKIKLQLAVDMALTPSPTPLPTFPLPLPSQDSNVRLTTRSNVLADALSKAAKVTDSIEITRPNRMRYIKTILESQSYLAEGQSYELCVTGLTRVQLPSPSPSPWTLFTNLRKRNPAPYAAYIRLPGATILSSSPERFLSWSRTGLCQLRPIKGTVKRTANTTFEYAKSVLHTPKEMAENLMIVDLIRHDLTQVAIPGTVQVPKLMQVEEYKSVYQLVSVIEGKVGPGAADPENGQPTVERVECPTTGFDVLAASLPPGSMTGAPKKRSVELLQRMEGEERGIYSGVIGYFSVCGAGDWSVVIRTAFRYDDEIGAGDSKEDLWRVGAGGAITALSDPNSEWDEMEVKLESTLRAFIG